MNQNNLIITLIEAITTMPIPTSRINSITFKFAFLPVSSGLLRKNFLSSRGWVKIKRTPESTMLPVKSKIEIIILGFYCK